MFQFQYPQPSLTNTLFSSGDALMVGCLFAINYHKIQPFIKKIGKWGFLLFPIILISLLIFSRLYFLSSSVNINLGYSSTISVFQSIAYGIFGNIGLITNLAIGLLIVFSINVNSIWFKFLNLRIMEFLGKLSYSIYLWQQFFTGSNPFFHNRPILLLLFFIFLSAIFSYYLIEQPFLRLKKYLRVLEH